MLGDDHIGRLVGLVDVDLFDLGRAERLGDELADVVTPLDYIHLFASELVDHLTHP